LSKARAATNLCEFSADLRALSRPSRVMRNAVAQFAQRGTQASCRMISAAGWGFATPDPSNPTSCTGGGGALRRTDQMLVDVSSATTSMVTSPIGAQFPCTGDSGAPWLLHRGDADSGFDFMGFAVHSRRAGSPTRGQAAPLDDNRSFIEGTITSVGTSERYGAYCYEQSLGGFKFRRCDQIGRGWGQLRAQGKCLQASASATAHRGSSRWDSTSSSATAIPEPVIAQTYETGSMQSASLTAAGGVTFDAASPTNLVAAPLIQVPCTTIFCEPKVQLQACSGGAGRSWEWGTF
jgi:hypothetical protein